MSDWLEIALWLEGEERERVEESLEELGAVAITLYSDDAEPLLEPLPGETPYWTELWVAGLFEGSRDGEALTQQLRQRLGASRELRLREVDEQEWSRAWQQDLAPLWFGRERGAPPQSDSAGASGIWVVPSHCPLPSDDAPKIVMDPGLAFGSGSHPTTQLCLSSLASQPPRAKQVIDYGCGSGILSLAALRLGAAQLWAIDIDPQALEATERNADRNGIAAGTLSITTPDQLPPLQVDLIVANILARTLLELLDELAERLRIGGRLLLSGITAEQRDVVMAAYSRQFQIVGSSQLEEWVVIEAVKI